MYSRSLGRFWDCKVARAPDIIASSNGLSRNVFFVNCFCVCGFPSVVARGSKYIPF